MTTETNTTQWLDDAPESWEDAPDHPPRRSDQAQVGSQRCSDGVVVHEVGPDAEGAYIYVQEGSRRLAECE